MQALETENVIRIVLNLVISVQCHEQRLGKNAMD